MKQILALCLLLALLIPAFAAVSIAEENSAIINKVRGDQPDFAFPEDAKLLEVFFPPVYGCDAAIVRYGDYTMLIDCAGNQWKTVRKALDQLGVTELDYAVNSHPDADHIGGFDHVLAEVPAGEFLLGFPEDHDSGDAVRFEVYEALHALNIPFRRVQDGEAVDFGDVKITVHQHTDEHLPRVNNKSVMLMIEYGERRILFTGDIQKDTQLLLAGESETLDLRADVLKHPHHGYEPMQEGFLEMVSPELVVCTLGDKNTDGVKYLKDEKISTLLTASGMLRLATDGNVWTVERIKK